VSKDKVLVVDDEPHVVQLLRANLTIEGYEVLVAEDGKQALEILKNQTPDLMILDLMLPGLDGYEVTQRAREFSTIPIIMLTARSNEIDIIRGFDAGADDYLTKPFSTNELMVRVRAVLRRAKYPEELMGRPPFKAGDLYIDFAQHLVKIGEREIKLTPLEYRLLAFLASNAGRVVLHEDLLRHVWGPEYREETEYLRVYIRYLRQKIEKDPSRPEYLLTRPGAGYMFKIPASPVPVAE
jgi:two-component system KDP operon response regulator KdpE